MMTIAFLDDNGKTIATVRGKISKLKNIVDTVVETPNIRIEVR